MNSLCRLVHSRDQWDGNSAWRIQQPKQEWNPHVHHPKWHFHILFKARCKNRITCNCHRYLKRSQCFYKEIFWDKLILYNSIQVNHLSTHRNIKLFPLFRNLIRTEKITDHCPPRRKKPTLCHLKQNLRLPLGPKIAFKPRLTIIIFLLLLILLTNSLKVTRYTAYSSGRRFIKLQADSFCQFFPNEAPGVHGRYYALRWEWVERHGSISDSTPMFSFITNRVQDRWPSCCGTRISCTWREIIIVLKYSLWDVMGMLMQKVEKPITGANKFDRWIVIVSMVDDYSPIAREARGVPPARFRCFNQCSIVVIVFGRNENTVESEEFIRLLDFCT